MVSLSHRASAREARFARNRLIRIGVMCRSASRPVTASTEAKYISARSSRKSSSPVMPS